MEKIDTSSQIAIIGMAGRFPGANNVNQLWQNLLDNIDSLERLNKEELLKLGIPESSINSKDYVAAARVLDDIEFFDCAFFGFSQREAELMDPQIRLLLQCAYHTFEDARIVSLHQDNVTGVYVGIGSNKYLLDNILPNKDVLRNVGAQMVQLVNDRDFAATQLAYRLNLTGPAVNVSTACSTSLVAVHSAVQALLAYECDMALAGGASITPMQRVGYQYQQGSIASPDGRCRPFDEDANGTCYGSGVATVLLKRFDEAMADGDKIYAVIRASAINNDGAEKIGFTAPSIKGQARVISDAIDLAEINASDISYIEAHGTATNLGDPIEFEALSQAFEGANQNACGIGSVKSNLGHLDTAAGITGLIKTSLSAYHGQIPASLHFKQPNPEIDLANSPFHVVDQLSHWPSPRIAGVSSFGMGGTNAHVIVAENNSDIEKNKTPIRLSNKPSKWHLLPFSANDSDVLEQLQSSYGHAFQKDSASVEEVSWSLFHTRKAMPVRNFIVTDSLSHTGDLLNQVPPSFKVTKSPKTRAFMFPGQGSQQLAMSAQLSEQYPAYKNALDQALSELPDETPIQHFLYEEDQQCETSLLQPALFCHEYALTKLWQSFGVQPTHLIGHSLGEYVAACIAGVYSLSDALKIVQIRANLMTQMLPGGMLAIKASHSELEPYIDSEIELAVINGPKNCVLAGPIQAITTLQKKLEKQGINFQRLRTSHAFHSAAVEPMLLSFQNKLAAFKLNPPKIPVISNVTGTWLTPQQATDPKYWCQHIRKTVQFNKGIQTMINEKLDCFIEMGPGKALSHFTLAAGGISDKVISGISGQDNAAVDLLTAMGHYWKIGGCIDTKRLFPNPVKPIDLPLYPFKKNRAWLSRSEPKKPNVSNYNFESPKTYQTVWQSQRIIQKHSDKQDCNWIFLADNQLFAQSLAKNLCHKTDNIAIVPFQKMTSNNGQMTAESVNDAWDKFMHPLLQQNKACQIINCWPLDHTQYTENRESLFDVMGYIGKILSSKLYQVPLTFTTITDRSVNTSDMGCQNPIQSIVHSFPMVMQQEISGVIGQVIDIDLTTDHEMILQTLRYELLRKARLPIRAIRNEQCWQPRFVEILEKDPDDNNPWINTKGHYLITGGIGQLGLTLSQWLANQCVSALTLVTRSPIPNQSQWQNLIDSEATDQNLKYKLKNLLDIKSKVKQLLVIDSPWQSEKMVSQSINHAEKKCGPIHGIFHCAAHFDQQTIQPLKQFNPDNAHQQFQSKIDATHALHKVIEAKSIDFVVLMSSLSAILAGPGHGIYSAANKFLDAQAKQSTSNQTQWLSIQWDGWNVSAQPGKGSITAKDAPKLFDSLFRDHGHANLAVACQALEPRFDNWVRKVHHLVEETNDAKIPDTGKVGIHSALAKCWNDIIGVKNCKPDSNFFALGGDSLAAVRLTALIQKRMNINVTAAELFSHSNFLNMTQLLTSHKQKTSDSLLVPLKKGQGKPILLIHPGGGGISIYQTLMELIELENPVYGIRARGVDSGSDPHFFSDMNHLAHEYCSELATKFKGSSVILMGYCFGGLIANEMAKEFEKHQVKVSKVILIDSAHPKLRPSIQNTFSTHLYELFGDIPGVNREQLDLLNNTEMTNFIAQQAQKSGKFPSEVSQHQAENYIRLAENHLTLELTYWPEPSDSLVVLRAEDEIKKNDPTQSLGWTGVPILEVPGDHRTMIRSPHVNTLAQKITGLIRKIS